MHVCKSVYIYVHTHYRTKGRSKRVRKVLMARRRRGTPDDPSDRMFVRCTNDICFP